jgi:acyl carrier protein
MSENERAEVARKVCEVLGESIRRPAEEIGLDDRLIEDLGIESVDLIALVFDLEDSFGRQLADEELQGLTTVGSIVDLLSAPGTDPATEAGSGADAAGR